MEHNVSPRTLYEKPATPQRKSTRIPPTKRVKTALPDNEQRYMSVKSTAFGAVRLTGADAKKFRAQMTYGKPSKAAVKSATLGRKAAAQYAKSGYAVLRKPA
jgi:hypothetical protein